MFGGHPMVLKEAAGSEWSCSKNAHPTNFFAANQRAQTKIQTDCYPYCKQGTDKLSGGKSKKDGLLIIPDFLWYFYFYIASLLSRPYTAETLGSTAGGEAAITEKMIQARAMMAPSKHTPA